jgi:hypothetical protein
MTQCHRDLHDEADVRRIFLQEEFFNGLLGNIITLLDDEHYAKYNVKFLIVGVPRDVRDYFGKTKNRQTIANRLRELPEVLRLNRGQVAQFCQRGFADELGYKHTVEVLDSVASHVAWVTDGVPQRLHEYCLQVALLAEKQSKALTADIVDPADRAWLEEGLSDDYALVQSMMNDRRTTAGRRNQALYALGQVTTDSFNWSDVETLLRREFPTSTQGRSLDLSGILSHLASGNSPIVRRTQKGDAYCFTDPRYRMCLRAMLRKTADTVYAVDLSSV